MVDSITGVNSLVQARAVQVTPQTTGLKSSPQTVNAIVQKPQKASGATAPVLSLAVPQTAKGANGSRIKVPRGSLIDVVA